MPNKITTAVVGAAALGAVAFAVPAAQAESRPAGPSLAAPADHRLVAAFTVGEGSQVYECAPAADGSAAWRGRPVASLVGTGRERGRVVGNHDSATRQGTPTVPEWVLFDGSRLEGAVAPGGVTADPDPGRNIAALRLDVVGDSGAGRLAGVDTIQRDRVSGGVGPTGPCDPAADTTTVVGYGARYTFWAATS